MNLGISTATYFPNRHVEEAFVPIAKTGAEICEVFFETRSQYCDEFANVLIENFNQALKINPLKIHSVHSLTNQFEPDLFSKGSRAYDDAEETLRNFLSVAKKLGAKNYTFHGATILKRAIQYNHDYPTLAKRVNKISDIVNEYGINLCYENVHWTYFHKPEYFVNLSPLCPDVKAVLDIKQARQSGYDYKEYLKVMGNKLETVHVCDYNTDGTTTIPGRGVFDFVELFKLLLDQDFNGGVLMELYSKNYENEADLLECYDYLKICLDKAKK